MSTISGEPIVFIEGTPYFEQDIDLPETDVEREVVMSEHCFTLYENRQSAYFNPLAEDWSFISNIPALHSTGAAPNARPIPNFARHGGDFRFTLDFAIQRMNEDRTRDSHFSQVWVAQVTTVGESSTHSDETMLECVVLKIVQPSLLPPPHPGREDPWSISPSARQLAFSEDWIFRNGLASCQGAQVPWYFGKFEVVDSRNISTRQSG